MKRWLIWLIGIKTEIYESHLNCLAIKWDRLPNPTTEEREVKQIPVTCKRLSATHWFGWLILRMLYHRLTLGGPKALLTEKRCLELYPLPRRM